MAGGSFGPNILTFPTADDDINPADPGDAYYNTTTQNLRVFNSSVGWINVSDGTVLPGMHYYNIAGTTTGVNYHKLSTPFDLDNKGAVLGTIGAGTRVDAFDISNDGTKVITAGDLAPNTQFKVYTLSVAFDLSSATLTNTFNSWVVTNPPTCVEFGQNGSRFWFTELNVLKQYDLSIPYDLTSTRTLTGSITTPVPNGAGDPAFSPDGFKMTLGHRSQNILETGTLTTAYDISTYTQTHTFTTPSQDPSCAKWNADGTKLLVRHASPDMVNEYGTTTPYSVQGMSFTRQIYNNASFAGGGHEFNYTY